jgi:serine/threonine protein kinase/WD40 repeat protein
MSDKVPPDEPLPTRSEVEGATVDLPEGLGFFSVGQVLGERYEILEMVGRGGMGEVWRAFDLKLRVEVALKALREDLFQSERRRELLRQEVRAAREVMSPNVCRIFDLIEIDGRELVSMEYVDGATLLGVLQERGPLELKEAQDIASQFLSGLEAIHKAGLVHRDVKPENIMLTRAGRVVVMDFGLARQKTEDDRSVSGTPAYMAPEHAAGKDVDARADVYSAGVVLAEMVSPDGLKSFESRKSLWEAVRSEPAQVPDSPWAPVIKRAVARDREGRQNSAHTLIRELEDVTLRIEGAEERNPYPGLASFTESDAEYFYGREAEIEAMWRTLEQPHLLAVIGPSGSGKSSFIRAGLIPAQPEGWSCVVTTPGSSPLMELAQALVTEFAGDAEAIRDLIRTDDPEAMVGAVARWRERHDHVLLVVDQFEELFTLNPPGTQTLFAELLGRLAIEHDVHVLLSMRDDFLFHCQAHEPLRTVFSELTPLGPLVGGALRRALVQPASRCGYRFEDDDLVAEMLAEVEGERGTLPLLAFAVSRLWEEREGSAGLLTREAYQRIGGVGGALGRHAEEVLERIGEDREPVVREVFRNLVTAQGTRAIRDVDELLSVFVEPERGDANEVLRELIDARLLTTFETSTGEDEQKRKIEIIHESLLANWPRLVRWQNQDAEAVQLRDQLRQAAKTWDEHQRSDDLLWTGSAFQEFSLWRDRYPGSLTGTEQAFANAMTRLAGRQRRRRRAVVAAVLAVAITVAAVTTGLWHRSEQAARRAEAASLLAKAQLTIDEDHTAALAWATSSLELHDTQEARRFIVDTLWRGPTRFEIERGPEVQQISIAAFSPDGRFLVAPSSLSWELVVWRPHDTEPTLYGDASRSSIPTAWLFFTPDSRHIVQGGSALYNIWSVPDFELLREFDLRHPEETPRASQSHPFNDPLMRFIRIGNRHLVRSWAFDGTGPTNHGWWDSEGVSAWAPRPNSHEVLFSREGDLMRRSLDELESNLHDRLIGRHDEEITRISSPPSGDHVASVDRTGLTKIWDLSRDPPAQTGTLQGVQGGTLLGSEAPVFLNRSGTRLVSVLDRGLSIWKVGGPPEADPLTVSYPDHLPNLIPNMEPSGAWYTSSTGDVLAFWPFEWPHPRVLTGPVGTTGALAFIRDGDSLVSASTMQIRVWPLTSAAGELSSVLRQDVGTNPPKMAADPEGRFVIGTSMLGIQSLLIAIDGTSSPRQLWPENTTGVAMGVDISPDGSRAAIGSFAALKADDNVIRVWDFDTGEEIVLPLGSEFTRKDTANWLGGVINLHFVSKTKLLSSGAGGIRSWDLESGDSEWITRVQDGDPAWMWMVVDDTARQMLTAKRYSILTPEASGLTRHDLESGSSQPIDTHGDRIGALALSPNGSAIATSVFGEGTIQVGSADGSEPHLLFGHEGNVTALEFSPDGRWIASGDTEGTIRLWPLPNLAEPPLHTLPREDLIAKLKALTNLRAVRDPESSSGWTLTRDQFRWWEPLPTW